MIKVKLEFSQDIMDEMPDTEVEYEFKEEDLKKLSLKEIAEHIAHANLIYEGYLPNIDSHKKPVVTQD